MLKIGFLGAGFVADFHRQALASVRGAELTGILRRGKAEALAASARAAGLGPARIYDSVAALCEAVDVIAVLAPNFTRVELFEEILAARQQGAELKGLICEKPLARNVAEADTVLALSDQIDVPVAYFENNLFMPPIMKAREQLKSVERTMGPAHLARTAEEHAGPFITYWFWDPTLQGGGVWNDMGCHSIAVGMHMLTPSDKPQNYLQPVSINAELALLKWGKSPWLEHLQTQGIPFDEKPAEDYANVSIQLRDPETGRLGMVQAANSWMFDSAGLRLAMETFGPGYSYSCDSLRSPGEVFVGDKASASIEDPFAAVENAQSTRGRLVLQPNEPDLYGYVGEWRDALAAFERGENAWLDLRYGRLITLLTMAGYLSHETRQVVDLQDPQTMAKLETYIPLIQQGRGAELLL